MEKEVIDTIMAQIDGLEKAAFKQGRIQNGSMIVALQQEIESRKRYILSLLRETKDR